MKYFILSFCLLFAATASFSQQKPPKKTYTFTLEDVIETARSQSTEAIQAKHTFRASYWQFRSYKAEFLPSLIFSGLLPSYTQANRSIPQPDGTFLYQLDHSNMVNARLALEQNLPFTGGKLSLGSSLSRQDFFGDNPFTQYSSRLVDITYSQSIFGLNQLKWDKKIEPLKYQEAKRRYLKSMEGVSITAIRYFFNLASAQQNLAIAEFNYANNDTLFKIAGGRYGIGTIGENDLLQSELNFMNSSATLNEARLALANAKNRLRSFLGFNELADIEIIIPNEIPKIKVELDEIMNLSKQNNPELLAYERQLIEANKAVATARASRGLSADLNLSFGLNQFSGSREYSGNFRDAYRNPSDLKVASLSVQIPILDWGRGKGRVRMAQSNRDLVKAQIEQAIADFEENIVIQVNQFNQQGDQFKITAKADTIAQNRYKISMQRYLIDKITITDMNIAQNDRDAARQRYINALNNYWNYYYQLRQTTLYDLLFNKPLDVDYDMLVD